MDKQDVEKNPHKGILFGHEKGMGVLAHDNMGEAC